MDERDTIQQRTREAAHLQLIAGNPFDAEDIAMFEMFDREGFSPERCREYILQQLEKRLDDAQRLSPGPDHRSFISHVRTQPLDFPPQINDMNPSFPLEGRRVSCPCDDGRRQLKRSKRGL